MYRCERNFKSVREERGNGNNKKMRKNGNKYTKKSLVFVIVVRGHTQEPIQNIHTQQTEIDEGGKRRSRRREGKMYNNNNIKE